MFSASLARSLNLLSQNATRKTIQKRDNSIKYYQKTDDKSRMDKTKARDLRAVNDIVNLIKAGSESRSRLEIVDITIIERLLFLLPDEVLKKFVEIELSKVPEPMSPLLGEWVKNCRSKTSLTQRQFAEAVKQKTGIKIHSSDVGNLESGQRKAHYTAERLELFRDAILKMVMAA